MRLKPSPTKINVNVKIRCQLFLSHTLIAVLAAFVGSFFDNILAGTTSELIFNLTKYQLLLMLGLFGLFLSGNIWRGLRKLEDVVHRLARGEAPPSPALKRRLNWPLSNLNPDLALIGERASQYSFRLDRLDQVRDQWLRQVGEAAVQAERNRLARDLHDSIKQQLFTISATATSAQLRWDKDPEGAQTDLSAVRRSVREA